MRSSKLAVALLALAALAITVPGLSTAGGGGASQLSAKLKGNNEVPGPGDPNGKGEVFIAVKASKGKVCFQIGFSKIQDPIAAHIHKGDTDVAGPVKVLLFEDLDGVPGPTVEGCAKNQKKSLLKRIEDKPERFYVNLHNPDYPDGAIRGQLKPAL